MFIKVLVAIAASIITVKVVTSFFQEEIPMDPMSIVNLLVLPLLLWYIKYKLEKFDSKREDARIAQAKTERTIIEQREAERTIILAMSRTMLLNNYEKCMEKGYYSIEEREVYHKLYEAYREDNGNGVIEEIAPRIRALPMEPPKKEV